MQVKDIYDEFEPAEEQIARSGPKSRICVYLSLSLPTYLPHMCIFISLSTYLSIYFCIYLSIYPSIHPSIHPSSCRRIFYSLPLYIHPPMYTGKAPRRCETTPTSTAPMLHTRW